MSPPSQAHDANAEPAPVSAGGSYSIQTVSVGCKIYIRRQQDGKTIEHLAEILSVRDKPNNPYARMRKRGADGDVKADEAATKPEDKWEFFVHWDSWNKRLDEWVSGSRLVLSRDLEWPRPKPPPGHKKHHNLKQQQSKVPRQNSLLKKATGNAAAALTSKQASPHSPTPETPPSAATPVFTGYAPSPSPSRKQDEDDTQMGEPDDGDPDADAEGEMDIDDDGDGETYDLTIAPAPEDEKPPEPQHFSKDQEIEKLRTSGSMTQSHSEIARVKNLNRIQMGKHEVDAWYFSPYPREFAHLPILYICEFCLSYLPSSVMLGRHRKRCTLLHPPGNEIYRHENISFFELDGKRQLTYCRNLSLLSKCFLDHKTLYYDVTPFLYYIMCIRDSAGCHLIGYFSKEKESADNYNVACILTLPQHQRFGYGKLLIEFSYELSKKEQKLGSPEKPLSDLGLLSYRAYWAETIIDLLMTLTQNEGEISIAEIAQRTSITEADVMNTCTTLQLFKHWKGQHVISLSDTVMERHEKTKAKRRRRIHPEHLIWKPPQFTRDQLRFGF